MITEAMINQYKAILGVESLPLVWSEKDLCRLGIRSVHCLRRDRTKGNPNTNTIPFIKTKAKILYPVLSVLEWLHRSIQTSADETNAQIKLEEDLLSDTVVINQESLPITNDTYPTKLTEENDSEEIKTSN